MDGAYESMTSRDFKTPGAVQRPKGVRFSLHTTNFKLQDNHRGATESTHSSAFKSLPMSRAQILRPRTSVRTSFNGKLPEPTYRTTYTPHEVIIIHEQKVGGVLVELEDDDDGVNNNEISFGFNKTPPPKLLLGVGLSLKQEKKNFFNTATQEAFQRRRPIPSPPLESIEKKHVQNSSVLLGDREKIMDTQTSYSSSFKSHGYAKESLFPSIKKNPPINLREMTSDQWVTSSKEAFRPRKPEAPVLLERRHRNASDILEVDILKDKQEKLSTTNQYFFPEVLRPEFPVHVDGASGRNKSRVYFGKPGAFYRTTTQDHFPMKEGVCAKPISHPPSRMLQEQVPERMLTSTQKDFVFQRGGRHELSQSELQRVRDSHIRFQEAKPDFSTTHREMFVPKPYVQLPKIHSFVRNISHMPF
ncbi:hypothetical protein DNTS_029684 [Danionella cerebrum]|uniref:Uncharacterized protein n=1 Tax=Danionella cerebrum TaxID=2873325 RepID=A0A553QI29_9TELE|nr:hypothetical protein DNTS_029684 [Danionella translucida]